MAGQPGRHPDFGLIGKVSLFGGFDKVGALTGILFVFTVLLSCFFDAMGTILGVGDEAKLTDKDGNFPGINKVLFVDGIAVAAAVRAPPPPVPASWSPRRVSERVPAPVSRAW